MDLCPGRGWEEEQRAERAGHSEHSTKGGDLEASDSNPFLCRQTLNDLPKVTQ